MSAFSVLIKIDVSQHTEKIGKFTYLSWAWAVKVLLENFPDATWEVHTFFDNGIETPYMRTEAGAFVQVSVNVEGVRRTQVHPVLDHMNKSVDAPNAFQINNSIQRCLAKAIALHGLGLYIYAGEDLPSYVPLTKAQVMKLLEVASKLGEKKHQEVADGIDDLAVHADNYAVTLKSLERRAKQNESS